jgi:hypothetical protein
MLPPGFATSLIPGIGRKEIWVVKELVAIGKKFQDPPSFSFSVTLSLSLATGTSNIPACLKRKLS